MQAFVIGETEAIKIKIFQAYSEKVLILSKINFKKLILKLVYL